MTLTIRAAQPADVPALITLIRELAAFEQLEHLVQANPDQLAEHLFGPKPVVEAVVVPGPNGTLVAFALFFTNYSTFLTKPGLYLEDLYVQPGYRGHGLGKRLLAHLAQIAVSRNCGRFEWSVLDWNANAIAFYERMGATLMHDWRTCRVTGDRLSSLAEASTAP
jgi:GNAT superfamily N-acetyltransferase